MRRFKFMLMLLAVMGIAASCEKVEEVNSVPSGQDANKEIIDPDRAEELKFVGYWTLTVNYDISGYRDEYEFRFYEDGTGHRWIDHYQDNGVISGYSYGAFTYEVKDGYLYATWKKDLPTVKIEYNFDGDVLTMRSDLDEGNIVHKLVRTEDADDKFIGDWDATYKDEKGRYIVHHYNFITPTYGNTYQSVYNDVNAAPSSTDLLYDFKYKFDDKKLEITTKAPMSEGTTITKYYRIDGTKLYLSGKADGVETMYSNFKEEHNLN